MACNLCDNTGWMRLRIRAGGDTAPTTAVKPCVCRTKKADREKPGGFESVGALADRTIGSLRKDPTASAALSEVDLQIGELIERRHGRMNGIMISEIAATVWPEEEWLESAPKLQRAVKKSVEKLRMLARLPIAATKEPPYGYYIPATAEECDDVHDRLFNEGIKLIRLAQLFKPDANLVEELRGQLRIGSSEL